MTNNPTEFMSRTGYRQVSAAASSSLSPGASINGVLFNGTTNITVTAASGTLTGASLASNVVSSSLTSLGIIVTGTWNADIVGLSYGGTNADLSATGGASQVLKQISTGAAITVGQLSLVDLSDAIINYSGGNMFIGSTDGASITTGVNNSSLGYGALAATTGGNNNSAIGYQALFNNTTGISNTAVGKSAAAANISGSNNIIIGDSAAASLTTGDSNIIIGGNVDVPASGTSNYLNIGNTITGDTSAGSISVLTSFSSQTIGATGGVLYKLPAADGMAGQKLTTDGLGNLSWT